MEIGQRPPRSHHRDAGSGAVAAVLATPMLFLLILLIFQGLMLVHAHHIAQSAAQTALEAARVEHASAAEGQVAADAALAQNAGGTLEGVAVAVAHDGQTVTATVTGQVAAIVPIVHFDVTAEATGPVERFIPSDEVAP